VLVFGRLTRGAMESYDCPFRVNVVLLLALAVVAVVNLSDAGLDVPSVVPGFDDVKAGTD
jgi:hypothetical protein